MGAVHWLIPSEKAKITSLYKMSENEEKEKAGKKDGAPSAVPQLLSAIALSFGSTIAGGWMSFSSVAIPKMMKTVDDDLEEVTDAIQIDLHTGAWIASLFFFGNIIGCLLGGFINQKIGSRRAFLYSAPLVCITWAMIALTNYIQIILLSRVLAGVVFGVYQANGKVYNAEIAHPDMRGSLGTIMSNMFALGSIYTYITGYFISSWRVVAWLQMVPACLLGISVLFIPDSPYWLVERGREEEARESLIRLRGSSYDIEEEFLEILNKKKAKEERGRSVVQTLGSRVFFIPFLRIGGLMMLTQWTGINVITSYMVNIFMESGSSIHPEIAPILVFAIRQFLALVSTGLLRVSKRRPLFLICASIIACSMAGLGTYSFLTQEQKDALGEHDELPFAWVPLFCVIAVSAAMSLGFQSIIQLLSAESFPTEIRSYASGLCGAFTALNMFGATRLYPYFIESLGFYGTFWMYGGVMVLETIYGAFSIPENKGQSLVKTEDKMVNNKKVETGNSENNSDKDQTA